MGYIPHQHDRFNTWQKQFLTALLTDPATGDVQPFPPAGEGKANWERWGIPKPDMQELVDAQAAYQPLYDAWSDEDARSHDKVVAHDEGRKTYEEFIRGFVAQWLRYNKKLNNADRAFLGLTVPDTEPTAVTPVDYGPALSIDRIIPGLHKIRAADPEKPHTQALPQGHKLVLERFVGDAGLGSDELLWSVYKETGRFLFTSEFTPADKGKTAYYRARYITTRGEHGPYGNLLQAVVA